MRIARRRDVIAVIVVLVLVGMIIAMSPRPALANYLSTQWRFTYKTSEYCTKNYDELSHNSTYPGGTYQSAVEVWYMLHTYFQDQDCLAKETARQKLQSRVWRWNGSDWYVCRDTGPKEYAAAFRTVLWLRYKSTPCGSGYYTADGAGWNYINGAWKGGWVELWNYSSTWYHTLPAS